MAMMSRSGSLVLLMVGAAVAAVPACGGNSNGPSSSEAGAAGEDGGGAAPTSAGRSGSGGTTTLGGETSSEAGQGTGGESVPGMGGSGGHSGSGGASGSGGRAGAGGTGGSSPGPQNTKLGRACADNADCLDAKAIGLTCVKATDTVLGGGAPPKGLCTLECESDGDCEARGAGSLCFPFDSTGTNYCIEGCSFGPPGLGEIKCHNRADFACQPALLAGTGAPCDFIEDCLAGEVCAAGTCGQAIPGCLPSCRGDIDCAEGLFCDQSFLNGTCVAKKPSGTKGLGEPCTVKGEPDDCLGFCQADVDVGNKGHCAVGCGIGNECSWNSATQVFDGLCAFASVLTDDSAAGDFGFCALACNCSGECRDPNLACSLDAGELPSSFRGPGLCFEASSVAEPYEQCAASGEGGAGGAQ
jgi:hypothetical protein